MMGRVTKQWTDGPSEAFSLIGTGGSTAAITRRVVTTYDSTGNVTKVERRSETAQGVEVYGGSKAITDYTYDAVGGNVPSLVEKQAAPHGCGFMPQRMFWSFSRAGHA
jgi:hypothetical protein